MLEKNSINAALVGKRKYFTDKHEVIDLPDLIEVQKSSYEWFMEEGLRELFDEISPITDFTGKDLELVVGDYYLDEPKNSEMVAKSRNATYEAAVRVMVELKNKQTGEIKEQEVYLGEFPLMTDRGTFIVNGVERVVVSQLIRSPGVFFTETEVKGEKLFGAKVIPNRGAWLEFETDSHGVIYVKIDRKRKVAATALLRAFGFDSDRDILKHFKDVDTLSDRKIIENTIKKDPSSDTAEGLKEVYKRIRPGDLATVDNAKSLIEAMFFNFDRYDFGKVGRYKLNQRLKLDVENTKENRVFRTDDLIEILRELVRLNVKQGKGDDIDHLGNRRVRAVGELLQNKMRVGLMRMERIAKDRMSTMDINLVTPAQLVNARPVIAATREFFTSSQLSQFMDQTNPLSELAHKRRLSAMGPGGLSRERAGFDVRDVHRSHYGRICPIATPEGPNIGLVGHMACFAHINEYGFIETPYRKVLREVPIKHAEKAKGEIAYKSGIKDPNTGEVVIKGDTVLTANHIATLKKLEKKGLKTIPVKSRVTNDIILLDAFEEELSITAPATTDIDEKGYFERTRAEVRVKGEPSIEPTGQIEYVDVSPKQIVSVSTSLIPFLEHDDANRALMGTNMQRQAVPCIQPQAPLVGTGSEERAARDSGAVILAGDDGEVTHVSGSKIVVKGDKNKKENEYVLHKFLRSNTSTCINQHPICNVGDTVKKGDVLADGPATHHGELAIGQNVLVAFMSWQGGNFEDAILVSERLVREDRYTSIHIEDFSIDVRDTKLGPEVVTRDIPNVSEEKLKDLDEEGVIRVGAQVSSGDILVGKITPKGETELTAEERLLRAIFGEKARDVKDTSLYLQHGEHGKVVDIKIFSRENGDKLQTGVIKTIQVSVAQLRKIQVGDKIAGRHGNKGVISKIVATEDMPHLPDGRTVDIILNPLGVASRMNIGQILETHLGWAACALGYKIATPVLDGISEDQIKGELKKAGIAEDGKVDLIDGRTGEPFKEKTTVGYMYILKLYHLVEDKIHQRSIGPYSLVTQQPLGGKAQFGGQRFGEMEVWALEGYGAVHTLQEMLTIKSDDVIGRSKTYESIIKGEEIRQPNIPESFNVLVKELKSLSLEVELLGTKDESEGGDEDEEEQEKSEKPEVQEDSEPSQDPVKEDEK
ncbi:DNA-directed RNA polymerase subunit beta [Patescibacteria group bacterium]|nr:DNA-directed RNA polymerase subunit beta [Patescibacteria group bacterium]